MFESREGQQVPAVTGGKTVPQVYRDGALIGGLPELEAALGT